MISKILIKATLLVFVAYFAASEKLACNLMCPAIYAPVCGTDGKTYSNECFLNVERSCYNKEVSVAHKGQCTTAATSPLKINCLPAMKSGMCTREYMPICGSDGKTYGNRCTFCYAMYLLQDQGKHLGVSHTGECSSTQAINTDENGCPPSSRHGICTMEWRPVCGSDGVTYGNRCAFCAAMYRLQDQGKDISISHTGQCSSTQASSTDEAGCPPSSRHGICTLEWNPVCGSNGVTYGNRCAFCAAMYRLQDQGKDISISHTGQCSSTQASSTDEAGCPPSSRHGICTLEWNPVCGSNGVTYGNRCAFCAAMYRLKDQGQDISISHTGQCSSQASDMDENGCPESSKHGICTLEWNPVCASDGNTYSNNCFRCAAMHKCENEGKNDCKLTIVKKGKC